MNGFREKGLAKQGGNVAIEENGKQGSPKPTLSVQLGEKGSNATEQKVRGDTRNEKVMEVYQKKDDTPCFQL